LLSPKKKSSFIIAAREFTTIRETEEEEEEKTHTQEEEDEEENEEEEILNTLDICFLVFFCLFAFEEKKNRRVHIKSRRIHTHTHAHTQIDKGFVYFYNNSITFCRCCYCCGRTF